MVDLAPQQPIRRQGQQSPGERRRRHRIDPGMARRRHPALRCFVRVALRRQVDQLYLDIVGIGRGHNLCGQAGQPQPQHLGLPHGDATGLDEPRWIDAGRQCGNLCRQERGCRLPAGAVGDPNRLLRRQQGERPITH
jgi:hypothetical protein